MYAKDKVLFSWVLMSSSSVQFNWQLSRNRSNWTMILMIDDKSIHFFSFFSFYSIKKKYQTSSKTLDFLFITYTIVDFGQSEWPKSIMNDDDDG